MLKSAIRRWRDRRRERYIERQERKINARTALRDYKKPTDFDARCALPGMRMGVRTWPADVGWPWLRETVQQIDAGVPSFGCSPVAS
jgi:hypothetical protein